MMNRLLCFPMSLFVTALLFPYSVHADTDRPDDEAPGESSVSSEIPGWIQQLDSNQFAERNDASRKLEAAGAAGLPASADAAVGDR